MAAESAARAALNEAREAAGEPAVRASLALFLKSGPGPPHPGNPSAAVLRAERVAQVGLVGCVFGNPFRPVAVDPAWAAWNAGTARRLAQAAYDERAFDRLPVLADALEEAGCSDPQLLGHLRSAWPHVRGCWAVDTVLGQS
jgi:hypothetical protein